MEWIIPIVIIGVLLWIGLRNPIKGTVCATCGEAIGKNSAQTQEQGTIYHARCAPSLREVREDVRKRWS